MTKSGEFLPKSKSDNPSCFGVVSYIDPFDSSGNCPGASFWQKTANFGKRFMAGAIGYSISVGLIAAKIVSHHRNLVKLSVTPDKISNIICGGFISAVITSSSLQSLICGCMIGGGAFVVSVFINVDKLFRLWAKQKLADTAQETVKVFIEEVDQGFDPYFSIQKKLRLVPAAFAGKDRV